MTNKDILLRATYSTPMMLVLMPKAISHAEAAFKVRGKLIGIINDTKVYK